MTRYAIPARSRVLAARLWINGHSYRQIADAFGVSYEDARTAVRWVAFQIGMRGEGYGGRRKGLLSVATAGEFERRLKARTGGRDAL